MGSVNIYDLQMNKVGYRKEFVTKRPFGHLVKANKFFGGKPEKNHSRQKQFRSEIWLWEKGGRYKPPAIRSMSGQKVVFMFVLAVVV